VSKCKNGKIKKKKKKKKEQQARHSQQGISCLWSWKKAPGHFSLSLFFFFFSFSFFFQQAEDKASIRIKLCDILDP
jgi:hypothetical protein